MEEKRVPLVADRKRYNPGETATIVIPSPFAEPVQALVTVARADISAAEVITVAGSATYSVPIEPGYGPNVYVSVALFQGSQNSAREPEFRVGTVNLPVFLDRHLSIAITPSSTAPKPGDVVRFDVLVTDSTGRPVEAEVGLALTDLALLSVGDPNSQSMYDFFWSQRDLGVITGASLGTQYEYFPDIAMFAFAPMTPAERLALEATQGLASAVLLRKTFIDTPLWTAHVTTDQQGHASVSVTLPDNLTTWRLDARAVSLGTRIGEATLDIVSSLPLMVRPNTPRFFVVGDEAELGMIIHNDTGQERTIQAAVAVKGAVLQNSAVQSVNILHGQRTRVAWLATVQDAEGVDLTFSAVSGPFGDSSKPSVGTGGACILPVYRHTAPDVVAVAGSLSAPGKRTEGIIIPTLASGGKPLPGRLALRLQTSPAAAALDGLAYLRDFPYLCTEQTISRILPNVVMYLAWKRTGQAMPEKLDSSREHIRSALKRLIDTQHCVYAARGNGVGWGWFPQNAPDPLVTGYALLGLVEARAAGFDVPDNLLQEVAAYLTVTLPSIDDATAHHLLNRAALTLYALARVALDFPLPLPRETASPRPSPPWLQSFSHLETGPQVQADLTPYFDNLFELRARISLAGRAFLAMAHHLRGALPEKRDALLSETLTHAVIHGTGTHWEEGERDSWNWGINTRTTAIILKALIAANPAHPFIPNAIRWLLNARRGAAWTTTQDTAWAVMALADWMAVTGETETRYPYTVRLNQSTLLHGQVLPETGDEAIALDFDAADLLPAQTNRLAFERGDGTGTLYYSTTLHTYPPVETVRPVNRGVGLSRIYLLSGQSVTSASVGDVLTVVLEIVSAHDLHYVNIEDPIPAGVEIYDRALKTSSKIGEMPDPAAIDTQRGWGWWWFSEVEYRTEKVVIAAERLPRGVYRYVYQVRVTTPGRYHVLPPTGWEFYAPDVFGRGAGMVFEVK
jgi:uncharacterized protein YfaS (alpha-2-macroglobulin family)